MIKTRAAVFLFVCLSMPGVIHAQSKSKAGRKTVFSELSSGKKGPAVKWDTTVCDMGKIPQHVPAVKEFTFTNTGNSPLLIEGVFPACHCTKEEHTTDSIPPGKTGYVRLIFNANNPGAFDKSASVKTNAGEKQDVLIIKGKVEVLRIEPAPK